MPNKYAAPTHTAISYVVDNGPWTDRLRPLQRRQPVGDPQRYHEILAGEVDSLDIWETEYLQSLTGERAVVEWTKGSVLRPLLAALTDAERSEFLAAYTSKSMLRIRDDPTEQRCSRSNGFSSSLCVDTKPPSSGTLATC